MLKSINYFVSVCLDIRNSHKVIAKEQHYTLDFATQVSDWAKLSKVIKVSTKLFCVALQSVWLDIKNSQIIKTEVKIIH